MQLGYHASHEQFSPQDLLALCQRAERTGFDAVLASDHIAPWSVLQASRGQNSGQVWPWLGAALQSTSMPYGMVTAPGHRYHPVVLAQAIATLCALFPGRLRVCLGSGEALNEHVTGDGWPDKEQRNEVLRASAEAMRRLWHGETVDADGAIWIDEARLYSLPEAPPLIYGAALTEKTSQWLGTWADGLIVVGDELESTAGRVKAFRSAGPGKPVLMKLQLSYADSHEQALDQAFEHWREPLVGHSQLGTLRTPEQFTEAAASVDRAAVAAKVPCVSSPAEIAELVGRFAELQPECIYLHNVGPDQEGFIDAVGCSGLL